jgi:hypothetical protein
MLEYSDVKYTKNLITLQYINIFIIYCRHTHNKKLHQIILNLRVGIPQQDIHEDATG